MVCDVILKTWHCEENINHSAMQKYCWVNVNVSWVRPFYFTMKLYLPFLVVVSTLLSESFGAQTHKKVLILGAGLAGLTAANELLDNNIDDFLILEGQDYIGGRIKQVPFGGFRVEAGANWLHFAREEESQPLWKKKVLYNVTGIWSNYSDFIIRNETGAVSMTHLKAAHQLEDIEKRLEKEQKKRKDKKLPDIPARVGLHLLGWKAKTPADKVLEFFNMDFEYSKRPELVSFYNLIVRGTDYFITDQQQGVFTMFNSTAERVKNKIKLNKIVKKIEYNTTVVKVTTSDGEVYTADFALCTFSTGVLASDMVEFKPPLPDWKKEAIFKSPMSVYTKIFLKFSHKFWDDHEYILLAGHERGFFPVFQDLERKGIFPNGSGMLLITVTEDEARRIEKQSYEATKKEITKMMRGVYGSNVSEPDEIFYQRWSQNPFTRGSYSEVVVGTGTKSFEDLAKKLGNLYFAGEASSEDWYGYMQGAEITGKEKGKLLVKLVRCKEAGNKNCGHEEDTKGHSASGDLQFLSIYSLLVAVVLFYY